MKVGVMKIHKTESGKKYIFFLLTFLIHHSKDKLVIYNLRKVTK